MLCTETGSSSNVMPRNFDVPSGTRDSPTISTTRPVTSGGKRNASRWTTPAKTTSIRPATMVMPRIRGSPPSHAALMHATKKVGPAQVGAEKARAEAGQPERLQGRADAAGDHGEGHHPAHLVERAADLAHQHHRQDE